MTQDYLIETKGLRKSYRNGHEVLRGLDLRVPRGSVYGFLGRNGAGKTTTIRILLGLIKFDGGAVRVFGDYSFPLGVRTKQRIGYLSQEQGMFNNLSVGRIIKFTAAFYPTWDFEYTERLARKLELPMDYPLGVLSTGQRQKVGLLLALAHRPDLLILDEPAASLDTVVRREFLESILDLLTREGITVLISSQILTDVERIADHIGILSEGKMLLSAPLDELKETIKRLRFTFPDAAPDPMEVPGALRMTRRGKEVLVTVRDFSPERLEEIRGRYPADIEVRDVDLEDIFIELLR